MKIRIATNANGQLESARYECREIVRALESALPLWFCAICGAETAARDLRGIRRGDVIVPLCLGDAPGRAQNLGSVIRSWIEERKRRAAWQHPARMREEAHRASLRRRLQPDSHALSHPAKIS